MKVTCFLQDNTNNQKYFMNVPSLSHRPYLSVSQFNPCLIKAHPHTGVGWGHAQPCPARPSRRNAITARAGNGAVHNETTKASLNLRHNSKFAFLTLFGWIETPNYFSFFIQYMLNQFIIPFRKISPKTILQHFLKINWSRKSDHFLQLHVQSGRVSPSATWILSGYTRLRTGVQTARRTFQRLHKPNLWSNCHKS